MLNPSSATADQEQEVAERISTEVLEKRFETTYSEDKEVPQSPEGGCADCN